MATPQRRTAPVRTITLTALVVALVGSAVTAAPAAAAYGLLGAGRATAGVASTWGPEHASARTPQARSTRGSTTYLHSVLPDDGAVDVVTYGRSSDLGATWTSHRLSRRGELSSAAEVVTAGALVHAAWWVERFDSSDRLVDQAVYVATSTAYGDAGSWLHRRRLPVVRFVTSMAASGRHVVAVGYTGRQHRTWYSVVSHDKGRTWKATRLAARGRDDVVSVVASGATMAAVYRAGSRVRVQVSRTAGRRWSRGRTLATGSTVSAAALGDRIVVMGRGTGTAVWVRTWRAGTWGPRRSVPTRVSNLEPTPLVALRGRSQVGILWTWRSTQVVDDGWTLDLQVLWRQSGDDGRTWSAYEQVSTEPGYNVAEHVMWRSTGQVYAVWERRTKAGYVGTHLRMRS